MIGERLQFGINPQIGDKKTVQNQKRSGKPKPQIDIFNFQNKAVPEESSIEYSIDNYRYISISSDTLFRVSLRRSNATVAIWSRKNEIATGALLLRSDKADITCLLIG